MKNMIQFHAVSKRYNLGLTRTSLPTAIKGWFGRASGRIRKQAAGDKHFWALRDVSFELDQGEWRQWRRKNDHAEVVGQHYEANFWRYSD